MFRLYKYDATGVIVAYHEAWVDTANRRIVEHWGLLGERGDTATQRIKLLKGLEAQMDDVLEPARALGFAEIDLSQFHTLVIEFRRGDAWQANDADKLEALDDALTEALGWVGLGVSNGRTTHDNVVAATCRVVDADLARAAIVNAFKDTEFSDYSRIYQE